VEIKASAPKHGIADDDIRHAWEQALRLIEVEYAGEERLLVIGPARDGSLLELVVMDPDHPDRIIHADALRPKFYAYL
jgi:hypothetical protein